MTQIRLALLGCCCWLVTSGVFAQQLSLFTQYRENATIINPAALESDFLAYYQPITVGASYRSQWNGIAGNPRTQTLRFSYLGDGSGATLMAGGYIINDQTGPTGFTGIYARVGTVISGDPEYSGIAVALTGGFVQYRVDAAEINLRDEGDILGTMNQTQWNPDVGAGIYFYQTLDSDDLFYAGISIPQVAGLDLAFKNEDGDFAISRIRHYYGMLGFYKFFRNDSFLEPSLWVKYVEGAPVNVDVNLRYQTESSIWIGAGGSSAGNFHFEAGFNLGENIGLYNTFKVGYGFDYSFRSFGPTVGSTHELQVAYSFDR
ncbi:MAG: PorP/SprF family type IX secretion system membrane protein [Bacteroidota bacterium]